MKNKYKFSEFCQVSSSKRILKSEYVDEGVPFYRSKEIIEIAAGKSIKETLYISYDRYNSLKEKFGAPKNGDILITSVGTLGITLLVDLEYDFYFKDGNLTWLKNIDSNIIDKNYLIQWLKSSFFFKQIDNNSIGAVQKALTISFLNTLEINLPNLSTQKQIAKVLSDLDNKIEVNNKINAELEAMAKLIYDYWFVQFDFPDANGNPYKSSGRKMVYNEKIKRNIPEGWEVKSLKEEMDLQYGFPFSTKLFNEEEKGVPVIRIRDILNCTISNYSTQEVDGKYRLEKRDVLVGMDGNFHINYWNKENCYLNQRCLRIRSTEASISEMQAKYMIEPYIKAREKNVSRTTVAHLSARDVNDLKIIIAHPELQSRANKFFNSNLKKIVTNREQNQKLAELRDWLLPMLMNGQVTVGEVGS